MEDLGIVGQACDLALAFGGGPEALGMAGERGACVNYIHMYSYKYRYRYGYGRCR